MSHVSRREPGLLFLGIATLDIYAGEEEKTLPTGLKIPQRPKG